MGLRRSSVGQWASHLYDVGLIALPCWGGGKALPGTNYRELADNPPSRELVESTGYSGGLSILLGTRHPCGGFVTGIDIDQGPNCLPSWPGELLLAEEGTAAGRWHVFLRTVDRLDGQINLRDEANLLVAEVKGYGLALRSWPTRPDGKPRGYRVVALAKTTSSYPPTQTTMNVAEWLAEFLSHVLKKEVKIECLHPIKMTQRMVVPTSSELAERIERELIARGVALRPSGRDGWKSGKCPFHEDSRPSFSISFELCAWKCWAGCGSGHLWSLARRLNISMRCSHSNPKRSCSITSWEVRG